MPIIYEPRGAAREYAALAANLYSGCSHGCKYCYAPMATFKKRDAFAASPHPRANALAMFKHDATCLPRGASVLLSFTTDPYQPIDVQYALTREAISILHECGCFVEILTKGGSRAIRDFDLLCPEDAFATSLTFFNDADSLLWEPEAALPADRISAIKQAKAAGLTTWASLEPVIDPEQTLALISATHEFIDLFKVGKLNHNAASHSINWRRFAHDAVSLLKRYRKKYLIKNDLKKFM